MSKEKKLNCAIRFGHSNLGSISEPYEDYYISFFRNGKFIFSIIDEFVRVIANMGAGVTRDFVWCWKDRPFQPACPFMIRPDGLADLSQPNDGFYTLIELYEQTCRSYNIDLYFSLYDACAYRTGWSPWANNIQGIKHHSDQGATIFREYYEGRMLSILRHVEIENEPRIKCEFYAILPGVLQRIEAAGIPWQNVIFGALKGSNAYLSHKAIPDWKKRKKEMFVPVHSLSIAPEEISRVTTRLWFDTDGMHPKPGFEVMYNYTYGMLGQIAGKKNNPLGIVINTVSKNPRDCLDPESEQGIQNRFRGLKGAVRAYHEFTGSYPKNYGQFGFSGNRSQISMSIGDAE